MNEHIQWMKCSFRRMNFNTHVADLDESARATHLPFVYSTREGPPSPAYDWYRELTRGTIQASLLPAWGYVTRFHARSASVAERRQRHAREYVRARCLPALRLQRPATSPEDLSDRTGSRDLARVLDLRRIAIPRTGCRTPIVLR